MRVIIFFFFKSCKSFEMLNSSRYGFVQHFSHFLRSHFFAFNQLDNLNILRFYWLVKSVLNDFICVFEKTDFICIRELSFFLLLHLSRDFITNVTSAPQKRNFRKDRNVLGSFFLLDFHPNLSLSN